MPANKYALLRYRIIDKCIRNKYRPYPSKEHLRQACEDSLYNSLDERISESTIEKDLYAMRNEEGLGYLAPIKYSRELNGYYYTDPNYSINDIPLNDDDIEAIKFATHTLSQFKSISVFSDFENAIEKLMGRISISNDLRDTSIEQYVSFESSPSAKGTDYLNPLLECIQENQKIELHYQSFMAGVQSVRILHPYLLKEYRNRWYLLGKDQKDNKIKTFGLDRIRGLQPLEEKFTMDSEFNPQDFFNYAYGITAVDEKPERIILEFSGGQGKYVKSQPLHHSQKILKETGDRLQISLDLQISYELIMEILSFGNKAKVLAPTKLVDQIKSELENALKNY
ncbi:MAG: WYL domain-containing protein [Flavobacteriales bacterium]|nr:WYL domain-containing protein [Flavobacteriales bacterium]